MQKQYEIIEQMNNDSSKFLEKYNSIKKKSKIQKEAATMNKHKFKWKEENQLLRKQRRDLERGVELYISNNLYNDSGLLDPHFIEINNLKTELGDSLLNYNIELRNRLQLCNNMIRDYKMYENEKDRNFEYESEILDIIENLNDVLYRQIEDYGAEMVY